MRRVSFPWCRRLQWLNEERQEKGVLYLSQVISCSLLHLNQTSAFKGAVFTVSSCGSNGISHVHRYPYAQDVLLEEHIT